MSVAPWHGPTAGSYFASASIEFTINEYWFGALTLAMASPNARALRGSNTEHVKWRLDPPTLTYTNLCVSLFKVIDKELSALVLQVSLDDCYRKVNFNWKSLTLSLSFNINKVLKILLLVFVGVRTIKLLTFVLLAAINGAFLLSALTESSVLA